MMVLVSLGCRGEPRLVWCGADSLGYGDSAPTFMYGDVCFDIDMFDMWRDFKLCILQSDVRVMSSW